jgi:flagellar basal-body rod protein FlgB
MITQINKMFASSEQSLRIQSGRASLLADNIANALTPGFKARDLDFKAIMAGLAPTSPQLARTDPGHIGLSEGFDDESAAYRIPTHHSDNGNTVEQEVEQAAFSDATLRYQASLQFLNSSIRTVKLAIKGE